MGPQTFEGQANVKGILPAVCKVGSYYDEAKAAFVKVKEKEVVIHKNIIIKKKIPGKNRILTLLIIPVKYCAFRTMFMYVKTIKSGHDMCGGP